MPTFSYPAYHTPVQMSPQGVYYFTSPSVVMIARTKTNLENIQPFLDSFDPTLGFQDYLKDDPTQLTDGTALCKFAGQLCYAAFGPKRTYHKEAQKYFTNVMSQSHGSILEGATYTFLFYGVDRAITKELCRHRSGKAISEISQRYVNGSTLRFVERASFQNDPELHQAFINRIEKAHFDYNTIGERLTALQTKGAMQVLTGDSARDLRKKVNESARACLPNETESPMVMTGNIRSWRHVIEMRASEHAEYEIRRVAYLIYKCMKEAEPILFSDYEEIESKDGVPIITTKYRKV